jgi:hypothetical protein
MRVFEANRALTAYRQTTWAQVEVFNGIVDAMRDASEEETFGVAAAHLAEAEAALARLEQIAPPDDKRAFHRVVLRTYRAYADALHILAEANENPLGLIAMASVLADKVEIYREGLDRLDFDALTVLD